MGIRPEIEDAYIDAERDIQHTPIREHAPRFGILRRNEIGHLASQFEQLVQTRRKSPAWFGTPRTRYPPGSVPGAISGFYDEGRADYSLRWLVVAIIGLEPFDEFRHPDVNRRGRLETEIVPDRIDIGEAFFHVAKLHRLHMDFGLAPKRVLQDLD